MKQLVLLRHGQSQWNLANRFTGWTDVNLSSKGVEEARSAGKLLKSHEFSFDIAFTSVLRRAIRTLDLVLDEMDLLWIEVVKSWRLNERHYGNLQGLNKAETAAKYGDKQVKIWRRSYATAPPPLPDGDPRLADHDPRYRGLDSSLLPRGESLAMTVDRVVPFWEERIGPALAAGRKPLVAAHGNSIRALIKYLDNVSDEDIVGVEVPTGQPLVYEFGDDLSPRRHYYLEP